jgi:hypothetical protein
MTNHPPINLLRTRMRARLDYQKRRSQEVFDRSWPFAEATGLNTPKMSPEERLSQLGVSRSELSFFMRVFGPDYCRQQVLKYDEKLDSMDPKGWRASKNKLSKLTDLADHFLHRRHVLSTSRCFFGVTHFSQDEEHVYHWPHTEQLILDLDVHSVEQFDSILYRYQALRELIDPTPLVFRTSHSRSMQLVWFLSELTPVADVFDRAREAFRRSECDLSEEAGVEIFPTPGMSCIRMPLGAHGELLHPDTLELVEDSFRKKYELIRVAYDGAGDFEGLFHSHVWGLPARTADEDDVTPGQKTGRNATLEKRVWEEGKALGLNSNQAVFHVIRWAYFGLGIKDEQELVEAVTQWVEDKLPHRSLKLMYEGDIPRRVRKHLDWMARQPISHYVQGDPSRCLTAGDYGAVVEYAKRIRAESTLDVGRSVLHEGLAELLYYTKQMCGVILEDPTVPLSTDQMAKFAGWSNRADRKNYYRLWLEALVESKIIEVVDTEYLYGRVSKCRRYKLRHHFREGESIEGHQRGFDQTLGVGRIKLRKRGGGSGS